MTPITIDKYLNFKMLFHQNSIEIDIFFMKPKCILSFSVPILIPRSYVNTLIPGKDGHSFADHIFTYIFLNKNDQISIKMSTKFIPMGPMNNKSELFLTMAESATIQYLNQ